MFNSSHVVQSRESMAWLGFGPNSQMVKMSLVHQWIDRIPLVPLSHLWPSLFGSFKLLSSHPHLSCIKTLWKEEGKVENPQDWLPLSLWKVRLERIVHVPFCARRVYDSFSALRYKLGNLAFSLLLFIWRQLASQKYGVGGQIRRELSLHILFILIHLNGTLLIFPKEFNAACKLNIS